MKLKKIFMVYSVILVILTVFLLPYNYSDGIKFMFGYPIAFFTIYDLVNPMKSNEILLMRTNIDLLGFIIDVFLIYWLINVIQKLLNKFKKSRTHSHTN